MFGDADSSTWSNRAAHVRNSVSDDIVQMGFAKAMVIEEAVSMLVNGEV